MKYSVLEMFIVVIWDTIFTILLVITFGHDVIVASQHENSVVNKAEYSIAAEKGSDISIPCDIMGDPSQQLSWYKVKCLPIYQYHEKWIIKLKI